MSLRKPSPAESAEKALNSVSIVSVTFKFALSYRAAGFN